MPTQPDLEPVVWTVKEVATLLRVSDRYVYMLVARGDLPALRLGRRTLIPRKAFERMMEAVGTAEKVPEPGTSNSRP